MVAAGAFVLYMYTQRKKADKQTEAGAAPEEPEFETGAEGGGYGGGFGGGGWFVDPSKNLEESGSLPSNVRTASDLRLANPKLEVSEDAKPKFSVVDEGRDDWISPSVLANMERLNSLYGVGLNTTQAMYETDDAERSTIEKKKTDTVFDSTPKLAPDFEPLAQNLRPTSEVEAPISQDGNARVQYVDAEETNPVDVPRIVRTQISRFSPLPDAIEPKPKTTNALREVAPTTSKTQISAVRPTLWNLWGLA
jgi:hypothetical protein